MGAPHRPVAVMNPPCPAVPWWRAEVPGGVVFGGRLLFFTVLFAVAMFRGRWWVSEPAGICLVSLAAGAAVATAFLHDPCRRLSNDLLCLLLAPWFVGALSRGAFEGTVRGAWPLAGGVAVFAAAAVHLRLE